MELKTTQHNITKNIESQTFTVGEDDESRAIQFKLVFEKLYANPLEATIREIVSNALDANKEVGNNKIEVQLPSITGDCLWIIDNGPGISPDRMQDTYMKVFSSTKRGSNDQIGAYGIGRLSCLSLAEQFPLVTVFNGVEYHYAVFLNEKGIPDCTLISKFETENSNGTKVGIPISEIIHYSDLKAYLLKCIAYTDAEVSISDQEVQKEINLIRKSLTYQTDTLSYYRLGANIFNIGISIGGVIYNPSIFKLGEEIKRTLGRYTEYSVNFRFDRLDEGCRPNYYNLILNIPIGKLELNTSREEIVSNETNKKIVSSYLNKAIEDLETCFWEELNSFSTVNRELVKTLNQDEISFRQLIHQQEDSTVNIGGYNVITRSKPLFQVEKNQIPLKVEIKKGYVLKRSKKGKLLFSQLDSDTYSLYSLINSTIILQEGITKKSFKDYEKKGISLDKQVLLFLMETIPSQEELEASYPFIFKTLQSLGTEIKIFRRETKPSTRSKKSSKEDNLGKYIRPVNSEGGYHSSKWNDLFDETPLGYIPEQGFYVVNTDEKFNVSSYLNHCTEQEEKSLFFVRESMTGNLPEGFVHLEEGLIKRLEQRPTITNNILYLIKERLIYKWMKGRIDKFQKVRQDLMLEGKDFIDNFETSYRYFEQEVGGIHSIYPYNLKNLGVDLPREEKSLLCSEELVKFLFKEDTQRNRVLLDVIFSSYNEETVDYLLDRCLA